MDEETGGAEMGFDDPCVVHKLFTSDSSVMVLCHMVVWCPLPQMHCQTPRKRCGRDPNVVNRTKSTIFVCTTELVNYIGPFHVIAAGRAISYQQLTCFPILVVNS